MEQSQRMRQNEINHRKRIRFARGVAALQNGFARLDIPIAILAPEKAIERGRGLVEFVISQCRRDFADGGTELEQNPFVIAREQLRIDFFLRLTALHLPKSAGVPKFVAK